MSSSHRIRDLIIGLLVATAALVACGDDTEETTEPTIADSEPSTSEPTTTEPTTSEPATTEPTTAPTTGEPTTAPTTGPSENGELDSDELGLTLSYPAAWEQDTDYGRWAFFGDDGFLILGLISAPKTIDEVAADEAGHVLQPYGTEPTVEAYDVDGRDARLILPSADAPIVVESFRQAAVIAPRATPDDFLSLYADPDHIDAIASSLRWSS